ncbi:MAG: hypothetical protein ACYSUC_05730 [Planctomycetota bacterium]|jgi:hypothetical protein
MFTTDLLNGQGIPVRSGPERVTVATVAVGVPVVIAIIMLGWYLSNNITVSVTRQALANYEARTKELADAIESQMSFEKEREVIYNCLSEVSTCIGKHSQWSPVLEAVVQNLPDAVVLTRLEAKQDSTKIKAAPKGDGRQTVDISVPLRTLRMTVSGNPQYGDKAVRDLRDRLRLSTVLGSKLQDIDITQKPDKLDGRDAVSYEINCFFKPGL